MSDDIPRIISSISIESYISRFVSLKQRGRNFWGLCPFHSEKTPSFSVSPERGIFKCFGCDKGGNVISFVQQYENISFKEALTLLADRAGISLSSKGKKETPQKKHKEFLLDVNDWVCKLYSEEVSRPEVKKYFDQRRISLDVQNHFSLGYAPGNFRFLENAVQKNIPDNKKESFLNALNTLGLITQSSYSDSGSYNQFKGRLIFPIYNISGKCIGFGGRILGESHKTAKYVNSTESELFQKKHCLYHLNHAKEAIRKNNQSILVEGYFDVIGLYQKSIYNAVAPLGTSFTKEQARLLKRYSDHLIIFFDSDSAGIEAAFRALKTAKSEKIKTKIVSLVGASSEAGENQDPFDISLEKDQIDILSILDSSKNELQFILWYFFFHKNNINNMEDKKTAILHFFSYVQDYHEHLWEKLEFIEKSSEILQVSPDVLKHDFKQFMKDQSSFVAYRKYDTKKESEKKSIFRIEKDVLAILLKFPELWENERLLDEMSWSSEEMYLLFYFFNDRLKTGEMWDWDHLNEVISILPENLSALLSGIILEFEPVLEQQKEEKNYSSDLKKMILQCKLHEIENRLQVVQDRLNVDEKFENKDSESLTMEFRDLIEEKKKIKNAM